VDLLYLNEEIPPATAEGIFLSLLVRFFERCFLPECHENFPGALKK